MGSDPSNGLDSKEPGEFLVSLAPGVAAGTIIQLVLRVIPVEVWVFILVSGIVLYYAWVKILNKNKRLSSTVLDRVAVALCVQRFGKTKKNKSGLC